MPLHLEQVEWMPSPPLVPSLPYLDAAELDRATFADAALQQEVLAMFLAQSADILTRLSARPANSSELAHRLKGAARAIGAHAVAEAAGALEMAWLEQEGNVTPALDALRDAVAETRAAIEAMQSRS